jgi:hypothetical protein
MHFHIVAACVCPWWHFQTDSYCSLHTFCGFIRHLWYRYGPVYKLAFGPRSFIVVSDPVMAKHVLKSNIGAYDKGVLASILVSAT